MNIKIKSILVPAIFGISLFLMPVSTFADTVGQRVDFNVNSDFDKYSRTTLSATLRHIGGKGYFYVDDKYWQGLDSSHQNTLTANIVALSESFDSDIYSKETSFWGSEPNPGVDGDPRITILLEPLIQSNGGYFETGNAYIKEQISDSNEREMISLNAEVMSADLSISKMFLAHEFQHLISFNQKEKTYDIYEDIWLNELRSEYAVTVAGFNDSYHDSNLERRVSLFLNNSSDSLTEWPNKNLDYAVVALFSEYLAEQFGRNILSETLRSNSIGISSINQYLQSKGYHERFNDIFLSWLGALYLNDISQNPKLGYRRSELMSVKVSPQQRISLSQGLQEYLSVQYLKDWQPLWLEYDVSALSADSAKSFKIGINGEAGQNFIGSYLAFYDQGPVEFGKINFISGQGSTYILNSDRKLRKVVILATKATKTSNFRTNEALNYMNVKISTVDTPEAEVNIIKDGVLIKKPIEKEIYVVWGKYKRYLTPGVIALYGHLNPANAIEVQPDVFNSYITSNYVRYVDDPKVYAVWPDETKHWLNITSQQWDASYRDWGAIFTINDLELNYYGTATDITR